MLRSLALIACSILLSGVLAAQSITDRADDLLTAYHETGQFDGVALIADGDEVLYERGFGEADRSWGIPNGPEATYRIASVTKQFTAALVLQLTEAGQIDLDAPISRYLPNYPAAQSAVTIHQLLSHTGGIPEHTSRPDFPSMMRDPVAPREFLSVFSGEPLDFEPGTAYRYSNSGYFLLGVIIEAVTGQPYAEALQTRLLEPLRLADSGYQDNTTVLDRMATGYSRAGVRVQHAPYIDTSLPYSAGMMVSTVRDLHTWTRALHGGEVFERAETLERMTTPVLNDYGYGIQSSLFPAGGTRVPAIGHDGGIPGFTSMLIYFPESEQTLALISNTGDSIRPLTIALAGVLHGQPAEMPRQPVENLLAEVIEAEGVEAGVARYRAMREAGEYAFDESQLNTLGYLYLTEGEVETAIRIFELNVEMYPEASNPYDSLGEAYFVARDPERSAANYQRSLDLDPSNDNARLMLGRIGVDVVEPEPVTVSQDVLDRYVGRFALAPTFIIEITREEDQLFGQATGQGRIGLRPISDTRFAAIGVDAQISFPDGDGPAERLTLHQGGQDQVAERVE
ncbi:MAG: serine hydrolase [Bacteroidota bacterium]